MGLCGACGTRHTPSACALTRRVNVRGGVPALQGGPRFPRVAEGKDVLCAEGLLWGGSWSVCDHDHGFEHGRLRVCVCLLCVIMSMSH